MAADLDDRIARLEEHVVSETAEEALTKAEAYAAAGQDAWANLALRRAKSIRAREQRSWADEEDDDDA